MLYKKTSPNLRNPASSIFPVDNSVSHPFRLHDYRTRSYLEPRVARHLCGFNESINLAVYISSVCLRIISIDRFYFHPRAFSYNSISPNIWSRAQLLSLLRTHTLALLPNLLGRNFAFSRNFVTLYHFYIEVDDIIANPYLYSFIYLIVPYWLMVDCLLRDSHDIFSPLNRNDLLVISFLKRHLYIRNFC